MINLRELLRGNRLGFRDLIPLFVVNPKVGEYDLSVYERQIGISILQSEIYLKGLFVLFIASGMIAYYDGVVCPVSFKIYHRSRQRAGCQGVFKSVGQGLVSPYPYYQHRHYQKESHYKYPVYRIRKAFRSLKDA